VRVHSDLHGGASAAFELGSEARQHSWIDYVQGVTWALRDRAPLLTGFDLDVTSTVPIGKGLSSSASLEVAVARAINVAYELGLNDLQIALACHRAESGFVGAPVGMMDQMVCSLGAPGQALFLDSATLDIEHLPLPPIAELAVIDSGLSHAHASGQYRTRRYECDEAAARLNVRWLRDITAEDFPRLEQLPVPLNRRARHVVTENARVLAAVDALKRADAARLGTLFLESHRSMKDDFEITTRDIDALVGIGASHDSVFGARMTGGGFGGAVIILCEAGQAASVAHRTVDAYRAATGRNGDILLPSSR
jgi:galactokinase